MPAVTTRTLLTLLVIVGITAADAQARPQRGRDIAVAKFRIDVDLDAGTVAVKPGPGILPGITLHATFASEDVPAQTSSLAVTVRNDSDRTLVGDIVGEFRGGSSGLDQSGTWLVASHLLRVGTSSNSAEWTIYQGKHRTYRMHVRLRTGVPLVANEGATIRGSGNASILVPEFSLPYETFIAIDSLPDNDFVADPGDMTVVGGVDVEFEPTVFNAALPAPAKPLIVSIPEPKLPGADVEHLLALQLDADQVADAEPEQGPDLLAQFMPAANASTRNGRLSSANGSLPGVFHGGHYAFLRATPRRWVSGVVRDSRGPRAGAVVRASGNSVIAITNDAGAYTLAVPSIAAVVMYALDPVRGQRGSAAGGVVGPATTLQLDVTVAPLSGDIVLRDGIRNAGFEGDDLSGWVPTTSAAVHTVPFVCSAGTIMPSEGTSMASITTAAPDVPASSLAQSFVVPAGVRTLTFDYRMVSSEFTAGSPAPDVFIATLVTPGGDVEAARVFATDPVATAVVGDCGDGEVSATSDWLATSVDLSPWGGEPATRVRLVLSVASAVDASLPTRVFVDNFRFGTVWVDMKRIAGATADEARAVAMVRGASEILRQAGLNVRLRTLSLVADPGSLADLDITPTGSGSCGGDLTRQDIDLTAEMSQILTYDRSPETSDLNAWLVRSLVGSSGAIGYAVSDDDFCSSVSLLTNGGILLADGTGGTSLAHETGHILLSPVSSGSPLEHNAGPGNFMLTNSPPLGLMTRAQAANIFRVGAPLVQP